MHRNGHLGINCLLYAPVLYILLVHGALDLAVYGALLVGGLATLPDIDAWFDDRMNHSGNILTHLVPVRHRGETHTVWFAIGVGLVAAVITYSFGFPGYDTVTAARFAFYMGVLGICGHLLGDAITPRGVAPLEPISEWRFSFELWTAGNRRANSGLYFLGLLACFLGFGLAVVDPAVLI